PYANKLQRIIERCKKSLLNVEIKHTFFKIKQLKLSIERAKAEITTHSPTDIAARFFDTQDRSFNRNVSRNERKTTSKLLRLIERTAEQWDVMPTFNEKSILNATNVQIPQETQTLLSLGPKFALPTDVLTPRHLFHMIADVEAILNVTPYKAVRDYNRCRITTAIQNHISRARSNQRENPVSKFCKHASITTKKFLDDHKDIVIVESDKGKRMVVMYIADYDRKMSTLLDDSTYKVLPKDPTSKFQRQNNTLVRRLSNLELIDHFTASRLTSKTATCPRIYGQPKAHKDGLPLRPVVPNITAPTYQLSKYIASVLSKGFKSEYNIIDSFSFVKYITAVTLPAGYILVSFDVVSLFTNIPKDLVIRDIIMNWDTIGKATNINLDLFLEMDAGEKTAKTSTKEDDYDATIGSAPCTYVCVINLYGRSPLLCFLIHVGGGIKWQICAFMCYNIFQLHPASGGSGG
ncbi:uncharacterized protein LOC134284550, partial [Aedes albopictus]